MVKLEEVEDEAFVADQAGPEDEEGDWDTDSDSEISSVSSEPPDETILDRLSALVDIIPPQQRRLLSSHFSTASSWGWSGLRGVAKVAWVVGTSTLLLAVPYALASQEETMMLEEEKRMQMVRGENEFVTPGATSSSPTAQQPM